MTGTLTPDTLTGVRTDYPCWGCHSLSRDGSRMMINVDDSDSDDEYRDVSAGLCLACGNQRHGSLERRIEIGYAFEIGKFGPVIRRHGRGFDRHAAILSSKRNNEKRPAGLQPGQFGLLGGGSAQAFLLRIVT